MTAKRMHDGGEPVGGVLLIGPGICPSQHGWGEPVGGVLLIGPGICPSQHGWGEPVGGVLLIGPGICPSQHGWGEPVGGVLLIGPGICPSQHGWGSRRGSPSLGLIRLPGRPRRGAFERAPSWAGSSTSTNLLLEVPIESLCALHASVGGPDLQAVGPADQVQVEIRAGARSSVVNHDDNGPSRHGLAASVRDEGPPVYPKGADLETARLSRDGPVSLAKGRARGVKETASRSPVAGQEGSAEPQRDLLGLLAQIGSYSKGPSDVGTPLERSPRV